MTVLSVVDAAGRRRSPATLPGYHAGRPPRNKGMRYPADPPTVEEIVAVMRHVGRPPRLAAARDDRRVLARRAAIQEALGSQSTTSTPGAARSWSAAARAAAAARSVWTHGAGSSSGRGSLPAPSSRSARCSASSTARPAGGPGQARACAPSCADSPLTLVSAPVCAAPAPARTRARARPRGVPLNIIQRQLGHANLGTTSIYLQGIDPGRSSHRPHAPGTDDVRQRRSATLSDAAGARGAPACP